MVGEGPLSYKAKRTKLGLLNFLNFHILQFLWDVHEWALQLHRWEMGLTNWVMPFSSSCFEKNCNHVRMKVTSILPCVQCPQNPPPFYV